MEETELEEGEACCYHNVDGNSAIDPDISFSYIDEKIQDVLGHFQKDFEGGVSAENLGAKFGGYGSFLPTYQWSPSRSHVRSPPENGQQNSFSSSNACLSARPAVASGNAMSVLRPPPGNDHGNQDLSILSNHGEDFTSKSEFQKPTNLADRKTLKFQIKVGTENVLTHKNAEIYSGLGLDVSPSSSLDDSPTDSEGLYQEHKDIPHESPTSILQIMTSAALFRSQLLSPLSDHMMQLTEKEQDWEKSKAKTVNKRNHGNSRSVVSGLDLSMVNGKVSAEKEHKFPENVSSPLEPLKSKYTCNSMSIALKKETDIDTLACEELVSNTLKLPLVSNAHRDNVLAKDSKASITHLKAAVKSLVKDVALSDVAAEEPSNPVYLENGKTEKSNRKGDSSGNALEDGKPNYVEDYFIYKEETHHKDEKSDLSMRKNSHVSDEKKSLNAGVISTSKQQIVQKVTSHSDGGLKLASKEAQFSSGGKRKSKGSQSNQPMNFQEDASVISSSMVRKSKKTSNSNIVVSKSEPESLKKGDEKATDRYREFFGDLVMEHEDDEIASYKMPLPRDRDSELVEKRSMLDCNSPLKERPSGKKTEELPVQRDRPRLSSNVPWLAGKVPHPDASLAMGAPLVKEDWVCCDKCQTWRLLPLGANPASLPEKWLCSMLDWLPGMNDCSVSEEETTNALMARYQSSAVPGSQNNRLTPGKTLLGGHNADAKGPTGNTGLQVAASVGKKKHGSKDVANTTSHDSFQRVPNLKNLQESTKSRSLNEVNHSLSVDGFGYQHSDQPSGLIGERCGKENKKKCQVDNFLEEGDTMKPKIKQKRENDMDGPKPSKRTKVEDALLKDGNCSSDHDIAPSKAGRSSRTELSNSTLGKDPQNYRNRSKDSKGYPKKKPGVSSGRPEFLITITSEEGQSQVGKSENSDSAKKRKANEIENSEMNDNSLPSTGHHTRRDVLEESLENDKKKEKKTRVSKSDGKDSNRNRDTIVTGKKAAKGVVDQKKGQNLGGTPSQQSTDAPDSLRRDLGSIQPSAAATSSSSKVSGSRRNKASHQEMKGSPVESVSSSPLKICNTDKSSQARSNCGDKDDFQDAGIFGSSSPRKSIEADDIVGENLSGKLKDDKLNVIHNGCLKSSVLDFKGRDLGYTLNGKEKAEHTASRFESQHILEANINHLDRGNENACQTEVPEHSRDDRRRDENPCLSNGSRRKKSGARSKEKTRGSRSELDNGKVMFDDTQNGSLFEEKVKVGRNKFQEKSGIYSDRMEKNYVSKKDSAANLSGGNGNQESPLQTGSHEGPVARPGVICVQDTKIKIQTQSDNDRSSKKLVTDRTGIQVSGRGNSHSLPPSIRGQSDATLRVQPIIESKNENGERACAPDDIVKQSKQTKKYEKQNGNHLSSMRSLTSSAHKGRDIDAPNPARRERDSSTQAVTNAVKEAKDLKHLADRLKNSGSMESTALYFQAALKFLHGASMLESCGSENTKHSEMFQSKQMYSSTAKLCEFCAHEYEKSKDMAAAALAYKCMEVAYLRVTYISHSSANRDRDELQKALQIIPTGESPSSSASDIDNLNNPASADKALVPKGVDSPQVTGNQVLTARNRSTCTRLMSFAQDVNFAMEASRKSRTRFGEAQNREGSSSVRRALDFNFQDVDELLRLVRVAMEAIYR